MNMKIERIEIIPVNIPVPTPTRISFGMFDMRAYVFVKIHTDDGLVGIGETSPFIPETRESQEDIIPLIEKWLGPAIIDEDPFNVQKIWRIMERIPGRVAAKGALDMAIYDLIGQALKQPIYKILGGLSHERLPLSGILGIDEPEKMAEDARSQIEQFKWKALRIKLGTTIQGDVKRFKTVREAVGEGFPLRVDFNGHYYAPDAIKLIRQLEPYDLWLVEQPVPWNDLLGLQQVSKNVTTMIQPDECYYTPYDLSYLMAIGAVGILGLKMVRPGGFTSNRKVIEMADLLNIPCYMNSAGEMGIAKAAALHFAFHHPNIKYPCEIHLAGKALGEDMILEPFDHQDGYALPPKGPGLGVHIDEALLKKYAGPISFVTERKGIVTK